MRCTHPRLTSFDSEGRFTYSPRKFSKEFVPFQTPCRKCISCRMAFASEKAVRCMLEAKQHERNCFITLTYSDENLKSNKLVKTDIDNFIKRLRSHIFEEKLKQIFPNVEIQSDRRKFYRSLHEATRKTIHKNISISIFGAGEYGEKKLRPHWHLIIFNFAPNDLVRDKKNDLGDDLFTSETINKLWGLNDPKDAPCLVGKVTLKSAGYCARYSLKKLSHGHDGTHDFEPIPKRGSKNAIGKTWIEKNFQDVLNTGYITLYDPVESKLTQHPVPRYFDDWLKKNKPEEYSRYVTDIKIPRMLEAERKEQLTSLEEKKTNLKRQALMGLEYKRVRNRRDSKNAILKAKTQQLKNLSKF